MSPRTRYNFLRFSVDLTSILLSQRADEDIDDEVDSDFSIDENDEPVSDHEEEGGPKRKRGAINTKAYKVSLFSKLTIQLGDMQSWLRSSCLHCDFIKKYKLNILLTSMLLNWSLSEYLMYKLSFLIRNLPGPKRKARRSQGGQKKIQRRHQNLWLHPKNQAKLQNWD